MGLFRGLVIANYTTYRQKERLIQSHLEKFANYTSDFFAGAFGEPDLHTIDDDPILVEPSSDIWGDELNNLPLNFTDLDTSIIKTQEQ